MGKFFKSKQTQSNQKKEADNNEAQQSTNITFTTDLDENIKLIKDSFGESPDLLVRKIIIDKEHGLSIATVRIDGMSDKFEINKHIIEPLSKLSYEQLRSQLDNPSSPDELGRLLTVNKLEQTDKLDELCSSVLNGNTGIVINQTSQVFLASTRLISKRSIAEPSSQTVIRGPKDSFTEDLRTNTSLIRARINDPKLRIESLKVGKITKTNVELMYIKGIAEDHIVNEVKERIKKINIDGILESNYIEEFIQDSRSTLFPTILNTERPDSVTANLLEGKFAIFIYGTPYVLIGPASFVQFFQSPEDYYQNQYISSALRILRYLSFFISLFVPALYLAIMTHHQGLIPTTLLVSLAGQREGVPFPLIVEALIMEIVFEVLREAGIRMPRAVGQTVSIVGALILGQAAVEAGFVSASTVIVVSLTAIANFTVPNFNLSIASRMLRFFLLLLGSFIGLYGILLGTLIILAHVCSLRTFGVPYFEPLAPFRLSEQKDVFIRIPIPSQVSRPSTAAPGQKVRTQKEGDQNES